MDLIPIAVYASAFLKELRESTGAGERPAEQWEPGPTAGFRDVVRVVSAIGAIAVFAAFLTLAAH